MKIEKSLYNNPRVGLSLEDGTNNCFFLSVEQVEDGFNLVMEEVGDIFLRLKSDGEVSEKVEQFACYLQKTYIRGTSRAPLFEPSIWNQNSAASEGLARTNNAVEGWHYWIQSLFSGSHPDVWTFFQKFRQDNLLHKFNAIQAVTGHQKKARRKYQQLNARVQTLINSYDGNKENIIPFLRRIAHLQRLIDTICYSSYYNLVLCVFLFLKKTILFLKTTANGEPKFWCLDQGVLKGKSLCLRVDNWVKVMNCLLVFNVVYYFAFDARTARWQSITQLFNLIVIMYGLQKFWSA